MNLNKILQFNSKNVLILICYSMLNACAILTPGIEVKERMLVPPTALNKVISNVTVKNFSGEHGVEFAKKIKDILSKRYIKVFETNSENVLIGNVSVNIEISYHTETEDIEREKDGKKYTETKIIAYYVEKSGSASVTYSLTSNGKVLVENEHNTYLSKTGSSSSSEEIALMNSPNDDDILSEMLPELIYNVISDIIPHKEYLIFELQQGIDTRLNTGIDYYNKQLYSQAEEYWNKVKAGSIISVDKSSAYYNLGVLRIHQGRFQDAFQMFSMANRLQPNNSVYKKALHIVIDAGLIEQILKLSQSVPASTTINKPAINVNGKSN